MRGTCQNPGESNHRKTLRQENGAPVSEPGGSEWSQVKRLSKFQKAKLAQLAKRAHAHVGSRTAAPRPLFDEWRKSEVFKAVGKYGLTECNNAEFNLVAAHFHSLLGED